MKKISRESAKTLLAIYKIINTSEEELEQILNADYIYRSGEHEGENIEYETIYDKSVTKFLIKYFNEIILKGVSNVYLKKIVKKLINEDIEIIGKTEKLYECSCCGYLTLDNIGGYDICRVCKWEDDGTLSQELTRFSHVNGCTLIEYKKTFEQNKKDMEIIFEKK